jgi:hypothetical protein
MGPSLMFLNVSAEHEAVALAWSVACRNHDLLERPRDDTALSLVSILKFWLTARRLR